MIRTPERLLQAGQSWLEGDPDPVTRAELAALMQARDFVELEHRLTPLTFGTAGLRGPVGAGSGRMNLAVVIRAAFAITRRIASLPDASARPIVIGFDARPTSQVFAEATAGVLLAAGRSVVAFAEPTATPLAAFVGRELGAVATIVVTASHNPRADNGYKVYGPNAVQISTPTDVEIARQIEVAPAAATIPRIAVSFRAGPVSRLAIVGPELVDRYFSELGRAVPASGAARSLSIVHSALHGVGSQPMLRALGDAGFDNVHVVAEQAEPDGSFPTTAFPNPEEPGTLDLALAEARHRRAELLLVSDPDADRLAAAARLDGELCVLDGNQVGALLADYLLGSAAREASPLVLGSVVSSPLVAALCRAHAAHYERTHTGFKWLWRAALALEAETDLRFVFAYEEALGYSVFPAVRDKDGIAAGRALAELAAELSARGASLFDRLYELYAAHGLWASAARNIVATGSDASSRISSALDRLVSGAVALGGERVARSVDYRDRATAAERPPWLGAAALIELELGSGARLFARPSGTEPKLKLYAHVRRDVTRRDSLVQDLEQARRLAAALLLELERALAL
jgi:phosphomannomutase